MRVAMTDYSKKAKPQGFSGFVYGRQPVGFKDRWLSWHTFISSNGEIKSALCGVIAGKDWELVTDRPTGKLCKKCNRFQMEHK